VLERAWGLIQQIRHNRQGKRLPPRYLTYIVSFACNARCIMCDSWKKPGTNELTLDEIEGIFRQLPRLDAVRLTGGEPFVRKDLGEIMALAEQHLKPLAIHITSNGFLTGRIVELCEQRRKRLPLHLLISLDGVEAKHNQIRGIDTAWKKTLATLETLATRQRALNLKLGVNQTIVDEGGLDHYRQLREQLRPMGVQHHAVMAYETSATYSTETAVDVAPTTPGELRTPEPIGEPVLRELLAEIQRDLANLPLLERIAKRYYWRGIGERLLHGRGNPNPPCVALNSHLRLYPDGRVPTCQFNSHTVGSLREQSFRELWYGDSAQAQRQWVKRCAGCWAECEVLPNAVYSGDLLKQTIRLD